MKINIQETVTPITVFLFALGSLLCIEETMNALMHSILIFFLAFAVFKGLKQMKAEKQLKEKEEKIIDFLFYCSIIGKGKNLNNLLKETKSKGFGLLEKEFMLVLQQINNGLSPKKALLLMKKRNKSKVIERAINLLVLGLESGIDLSNVFRQTAIDLMQTKHLIKERNSALLIQKYTLILSATIVLPLILAMITQMVSSFDFSILSSIMNANNNERIQLIEAAKLAINFYLIEFAFLSSAFLALSEGRKSVLLVNGSIYAVIAVFLFNFLSQTKVF